jgi:hypothetical protein
LLEHAPERRSVHVFACPARRGTAAHQHEEGRQDQHLLSHRLLLSIAAEPGRDPCLSKAVSSSG